MTRASVRRHSSLFLVCSGLISTPRLNHKLHLTVVHLLDKFYLPKVNQSGHAIHVPRPTSACNSGELLTEKLTVPAVAHECLSTK